MRYAAEISYDGSCFCGWQRQLNLPSVQESLEAALTLINGSFVKVAGAGRTDAGVHARAQVCSFDMDADWEPRRLMLAVNANIPKSISVMRIARVRSDFHARFDAASREYKYFIWNSSTIYPHIMPVTCWVKSRNRNWKYAAEACRYLEGTHDFRNFSRKGDLPADTTRTIYHSKLVQKGNLVIFHIKGSGFLANMVRIIVGNLEKTATGEHPPEWIRELFLPGADRNDGGRTCPACGLFLWKINYSEKIWQSH